MIYIQKFDDTKIFSNSDDILLDYIILKTIMVLMTCVVKDNGKFHPQLFLGEVLFIKQKKWWYWQVMKNLC